MKQCPTCNRTYEDLSLRFCLDDGSVLNTAYDVQETQRVVSPRPTNAARTEVLFGDNRPQPPVKRSNTLAIVLIGLLLLASGVIVVAVAIFVVSRDTPNPSSTSNKNKNESNSSSTTENASPAQQLVGNWRATVDELGNKYEIYYSFNADGTSSNYFIDVDGKSEPSKGSWRYSDGILYEKFSDGASGRGSVEWIDKDSFSLTIIDNGVPAYKGLKRRYQRVS